jgi:hypothetical protein
VSTLAHLGRQKKTPDPFFSRPLFLEADSDGNNAVNFNDFLGLQNNFGVTLTF